MNRENDIKEWLQPGVSIDFHGDFKNSKIVHFNNIWTMFCSALANGSDNLNT